MTTRRRSAPSGKRRPSAPFPRRPPAHAAPGRGQPSEPPVNYRKLFVPFLRRRSLISRRRAATGPDDALVVDGLVMILRARLTCGRAGLVCLGAPLLAASLRRVRFLVFLCSLLLLFFPLHRFCFLLLFLVVCWPFCLFLSLFSSFFFSSLLF